ncbi:MAG: pentapeptide repeat-containing protein [Acidimicrobiales bacterium]
MKPAIPHTERSAQRGRRAAGTRAGCCLRAAGPSVAARAVVARPAGSVFADAFFAGCVLPDVFFAGAVFAGCVLPDVFFAGVVFAGACFGGLGASAGTVAAASVRLTAPAFLAAGRLAAGRLAAGAVCRGEAAGASPTARSSPTLPFG